MTSRQVGSRFAGEGQPSLSRIALILLGGFLIFPLCFPLIPHYQEPLSDVQNFAPTLGGGLLYAALVGALFFVCWLGYRLALRAEWTPSFRWLLAWSALFGLVLIFTYPINANDVFRYFLRGRVAVMHGENPYETPPNAFPDDPYLMLGGEWIDATSPYGPLWELVDSVMVGVTGSDLLVSLIGFKLIGLLSLLGCGWVIYQLLEGESEQLRFGRTLLWLWNPASMLMFVVDAHNDAFMLFWLLLGLLQLRKHGRPRLGMSLMVIAVLVKATAIVALGIFAIAQLRQVSQWAGRIRLALWWLIGSIVIVLVSLLPYGNPSGLIARLFNEAGTGGGFSPLVMVYFVGQQFELLSFRIAPAARLFSYLFLVLAVVFAGLTWSGRSALRNSADSYLAYLLTALKFRIWYTLWIFPWLLLDNASERRLLFGYLLLVTSQLSVVHYNYGLRFVYAGSMEIAHFIGIPFVFGLPLMLAWRAKISTSYQRGKNSG